MSDKTVRSKQSASDMSNAKSKETIDPLSKASTVYTKKVQQEKKKNRLMEFFSKLQFEKNNSQTATEVKPDNIEKQESRSKRLLNNFINIIKKIFGLDYETTALKKIDKIITALKDPSTTNRSALHAQVKNFDSADLEKALNKNPPKDMKALCVLSPIYPKNLLTRDYNNLKVEENPSKVMHFKELQKGKASEELRQLVAKDWAPDKINRELKNIKTAPGEQPSTAEELQKAWNDIISKKIDPHSLAFKAAEAEINNRIQKAIDEEPIHGSAQDFAKPNESEEHTYYNIQQLANQRHKPSGASSSPDGAKNTGNIETQNISKTISPTKQDTATFNALVEEFGNQDLSVFENANPDFMRSIDESSYSNETQTVPDEFKHSYLALRQDQHHKKGDSNHKQQIAMLENVSPRYPTDASLVCNPESVVKNTKGEAYFHANFISAPYGTYIASQGPTTSEKTFSGKSQTPNIAHFLNMISGKGVKCINDMTNENDASIDKRTESYVPQAGQKVTYTGGDGTQATIENLKETKLFNGEFTLQHLLINEKSCFRLQNNHFNDRTTGKPGQLLVQAFLARKISPDFDIPISTNCTAGIGRTGTSTLIQQIVDASLTSKSASPKKQADHFSKIQQVVTREEMESIVNNIKVIDDKKKKKLLKAYSKTPLTEKMMKDIALTPEQFNAIVTDPTLMTLMFRNERGHRGVQTAGQFQTVNIVYNNLKEMTSCAEEIGLLKK